MILTHGSNSLTSGGGGETTEWDTTNVPADYIVTNGGVKAIPYDEVGLSNKVVMFKKNNTYSSDNVGLSNKVVSFTLIQ
jgi:hypothetical protein